MQLTQDGILTSTFLIALYNDDNHGEATFPLDIDDPTGLYHYRIMVNYPVSA